MTSRMQESLARAAEELGIRVIVGYVARLPEGDSFRTQALFPDLGGPRGMIVFESGRYPDAIARRRLVDYGFSISMFSEPLPNEVFDVNNYAEMFAEWGWTGDENSKPEWMP